MQNHHQLITHLSTEEDSMKRLAILLVLLSGVAQAYEADRAKNNFAHEMVRCAAYFATASECVANTMPEEPLAQALDLQAALLLQGSAELTSTEVMNARLKMEYESMHDAINNRCENISTLMVEHQDVCTSLSNDPESRMLFWLQKEDS
jgi:hypothetical protein